MGCNDDAEERGADLRHVVQWLCVPWSQKAVEAAGQFVRIERSRTQHHDDAVQPLRHMCDTWPAGSSGVGSRTDIRLGRPTYVCRRIRRVVAKAAFKCRCT